MKHLTINEYGVFLGLESSRLKVKVADKIKYYPLNRLRTLTIAQGGVSVSSNLIEALSYRGIKVFFSDFKGTPHSQLIPSNHHGVVSLRVNQMNFCQDEELSIKLAKKIIKGKLTNQKATLLYFSKYKEPLENSELLKLEATKIANIAKNLETSDLKYQELLGKEGAGASMYFQALKNTVLSQTSFKKREGRGTREIINQMLNYGYGILFHQIMNSILNAGLEPYLGILHKSRPGKPALALDIMEEYRSWIVDRSVIKLKQKAQNKQELTQEIRKALVTEIMKKLHKKHPYRKKMLALNFIIQRQVYKLCGHFAEETQYRPYLFKW